MEVQYARADDGTHIAYRVLDAALHTADGHDIVMVSGGFFPMESFDDYAGLVRLIDGLRSVGRVVVFDRRGVGLSDPPSDLTRPILDQWADDVRAVVDASEVTNTVVFAWDGFGVGSRCTQFSVRDSSIRRIIGPTREVSLALFGFLCPLALVGLVS